MTLLRIDGYRHNSFQPGPGMHSSPVSRLSGCSQVERSHRRKNEGVVLGAGSNLYSEYRANMLVWLA
jgi:hypothetical protein